MISFVASLLLATLQRFETGLADVFHASSLKICFLMKVVCIEIYLIIRSAAILGPRWLSRSRACSHFSIG